MATYPWERSAPSSEKLCNTYTQADVPGSRNIDIFGAHRPKMCRPAKYTSLAPVHEKEPVDQRLVIMGCAAGLCLACIVVKLIPTSPDREASATVTTTLVKKKDGVSIFGPDKKETASLAPKNENEAAPVSANRLTAEMVGAYVELYAPVAVEEMKWYKIPASISLAQGLIESRAGDSKLARSNNNHFGLKCFSRTCRKGHCSNFTDDTHKDFFRKFPTCWDSWRAHSLLLQKDNYRHLRKHGKDYRAWAVGLKNAGYATDRTYSEKLIGIIEKYMLHQYDK